MAGRVYSANLLSETSSVERLVEKPFKKAGGISYAWGEEC